MRRPLVFGIFQYVGPNGTIGSSWLDPRDTSAEFMNLDYWTTLARKLEDARIDLLFLADSHGFPALDGELLPAAVREGRQIPHGDPLPVVSALAATTSRLGFILTMSTTAELPGNLARRLATLDHLSAGRIAWNVVTGSSGETAAALLGKPLIPHDLRYDMADDFLDVCFGLWEGSWEDGALVRDKAAGVFADPAKVHMVRHHGPHFWSEGVLTMPPSPQRTPLLVQAGTSRRGVEFAGRNAEVVFVAGGDPEQVKRNIAAIRAAAVAAGREPDAIRVLIGSMFITAPSSEQAQAKYERMLALSSVEGAAAVFAGNTGVDLLRFELDSPLPLDLSTEQGLSNLQRYMGTPDKPGPTVREILETFRTGGINGSVLVGDPEEVAEQTGSFAEYTDADGFLVQPNVNPESYDDFIELLLPALRRRGLAQEDYAPGTLRERLFGQGQARLPESHRGSAFRTAGLRAAAATVA